MVETTNRDITVLCAAIDAGDESALLPLADVLEEAGEGGGYGSPCGRPWALRWMRRGYYRPMRSNDEFATRYGWMEVPETEIACGQQGTLHPGLTSRLQGCVVETGSRGELVYVYPTRSAAFLALAEALS